MRILNIAANYIRDIYKDLTNLPNRAEAEMPPFEAFTKIPRLYRDVVVTEKIDGTNAQIYITSDGRVLAGSRNRWLTIADDNYGFARWVQAHEEELRVGLGIGRHFGEWWGSGIVNWYGCDPSISPNTIRCYFLCFRRHLLRVNSSI